MPTPIARPIFHHRPIVRLFLLAAACLLLSACATATPPPLTPPIEPQSMPTELPTATPMPTITTASTSALMADVAALPALFADSLGITLQPDSGTWEGVEVLPLTAELWAAFTYGFRSFDPLKNHAVAIFTQEDGFWVELGRVELECGDYVDKRSIQQVYLDQESIWLAADTGTGAHSGCFDLLRWDGNTLAIGVSSFNSSPGAGEVQDVDGDGQMEVVLNASDPYVFCYACGVRLYNISILRWGGTELLPVELTRLPDDAVADLRDANNRAVELAEASLFPAALPLIDQALGYAPNDERVYWNSRLIHALAQGRQEYAGSTPYPLLNWIFYGDWDAAQAELQEYTSAQIFDPQRALLEKTAAAGWEETLADWILTFSQPALDVEPDLAPAWFLQGWARFLKNPSDPAVVGDVEEAARLAPDETLYRRSLEQLQGRGISQPTPMPTATPRPSSTIPSPATVEIIHFAAGATVYELSANLSGSVVRGFQLGIGTGQKFYVTGPSNVKIWLLNPEGQPITPVADGGATRFDIPTTATYMLVLQSSASADLLLAIPPLSDPETPAPASSERVRFAAGATSATLEPTLTRGTPVGYVLGIGAGQRLWVTAPLGDMNFWVLDPDGKTLSPIVPRTTRSGEYAIPRTGDYTLVLDGEGPVQVVMEIPPR